MARKKGLTQDEIFKLLQELSDNDSGSEIDNDFISNDSHKISSDSEFIVTTQNRDASSSSSNESENVSHPNSISNVPQKTRTGQKSRSEKKGRSHIFQEVGYEEIAKDGTTWKVENATSTSGRRALRNILRETAGVTSYAKRNACDDKPISAWRLMINEKILHIIKECTEAEAKRRLENETWNISLQELDAFIALLYVRGALAAKSAPILSLWSKTWGPKFFHETMSRDRFLEIMKFLRFDNKSTRSLRLPNDKFALISDIWNTFIENCQICFRPGENITVDEQLFPTKTRCRFLQYMPQKPDKFGIKFWLAVDVQSKYLVNGFPYLGKDEMRPNDQSLGESVVNRLVEPYKNTGRNITTDSFFTSLKLAKSLRNKGMSCVGTINRVKKEVPTCLKSTRNELFSSVVMKHDDITLTSYQGKRNKNVILLSTLHSAIEFDSNEKKTPDVIRYYNSTKYGVDIVDQMSRKYSVKSPSRRWPVHVFFNILDLAAINAWIIFKEITKKDMSRRDFLLTLAQELREEYISTKEKPKVIQRISMPPANSSECNKRKKCQILYCKGNKTLNECGNCNKNVCGRCTGKIRKISICVNCNAQD